jgi:hypothetical protein
MGIIFLGNPDYPDHQPLPTSFPNRRQMIAPVAVTLAAYGLCPAYHDHNEHGPHQEPLGEDSNPALRWVASGGSSVNSIVPDRSFGAADAVIRIAPSSGFFFGR